MEEFAKTIPKGLMTIGPDKRDYIIKHVFAAQKPGPKVFVELGGYVGYSAIALASALVEHNSPHQIKYFSLEKNPLMAAVTSSFVELAGLKDVIQVCVGPAEASIKRLAAKGALQKEKVDFMLLDHWKDFYISDLQLCEELGLLHEGTVVMGDNIVFPGAPEYLAYVQQGRAERSSGGLKYRTKTEDFMLPFGGPVSCALIKLSALLTKRQTGSAGGDYCTCWIRFEE